MDTGHLRLLIISVILTLLSGCSRADIHNFLVERERRLAGLSVQQVSLEGQRIVYLTNDRQVGRETLFLVHGFGGNKDNWVRMAAHLSAEYNLVIPDLIGHGDSSPGEDADYPVEAQSRQLARLMEALDTGPVHMGGNSMGGGITIYFASRYPEHLRSVTLFDPAGSDRYPSELDEQLAEGINPLMVRKPGDLRRLMNFVLEQKPYVPGPILEVMEKKAIDRQPTLERIFSAMMASMHDHQLETVLGAISVPALVVWGKQDRVLHPDNAEVFEQLIPDARRVMLDGVGHIPMLEVPERSASLMKEFVSGLRSGPFRAESGQGRPEHPQR